MKITLDFPSMFGGDLEKYSMWNIRGAARVILRRPEEIEITLEVYYLHRKVLENLGYDPEKLERGDSMLVDLVVKGVSSELN